MTGSASVKQTIVITGSTKGIGKGLAKAFIQRGHNVVISGRSQADVDACIVDIINQSSSDDSPNSGHHTQKSIQQSRQQLLGVAANTTSPEQINTLWQQAIERFGCVDIWINNAGLARTTWSIVDTPFSEVTHMVNTNILGTINCCQTVASKMLQQGHGKIFNMLGGGSDGEYFQGMGVYGTTKRGLDYFTNALSKELKHTPIIVGKVRPGMVITEGVIREAKQNMANFSKRRKMANVLCDHVDTVAPFLVDKMLLVNKTGEKIAWLNPRKMTLRFLGSVFKTPKDKFAQYGL
ncbi:SDR family NAD(P)-dependent oxidoreductase [Thalassotalea maritima]|uniref:SDR family NAD(P)-dependent oxidoreductase n=1 Tax=Thalassotalea maritima TaxID=3242416 RepID=UPI003529564A